MRSVRLIPVCAAATSVQLEPVFHLVTAGVVLGFLEVLERDVCLLVFCDDQDADLAVLRPGHGVDDGDELAVQVRKLREADELRLDALGEPAGGSRSVGGGSRSVGLRWL